MIKDHSFLRCWILGLKSTRRTIPRQDEPVLAVLKDAVEFASVIVAPLKARHCNLIATVGFSPIKVAVSS